MTTLSRDIPTNCGSMPHVIFVEVIAPDTGRYLSGYPPHQRFTWTSSGIGEALVLNPYPAMICPDGRFAFL